jgi:hypothetical protein
MAKLKSGTRIYGNATVDSTLTASAGPILVGTASSTGTSSQTLQVTGGAYVSGNLGIGTINPLGTLQVGTGTTTFIVTGTASTALVGIGTTNPRYIFTVTDTGTPATTGLTNCLADFTTTANSYGQINLRNTSTGTNASGDIIITADNGTDSSNFIDLGINNSGFSVGSWTINGATDGYLYTSDGNLSIGAAAANKYLSFFTGGTLISNERMRINATGVGIGTTNPTSRLDIAGDVRVTGVVTAIGGFNIGIQSSGIDIATGVVTALNFVGSGNTFSYNAATKTVSISIVGGGSGGSSSGYANTAGISTNVIGGIASVTQLNVSGISTLGTVRVSSGIVTAVTGVVTYYGDGSKLSDVFFDGYYTGITSTITSSLVGVGATILTLPSTAGIEYVIYSINCSNIAVGNTEVQVIGAFDFNTTSGVGFTERSYFAYNIPIPTGTSVELLKQPQVLNPSERITMRSTDYNRVGVDTGVQVYINYMAVTSTKLFGVGVGSVSLGSTDSTRIYTATSPSVVQSIRLVNRTDTGSYPVTVRITSGIVSTSLVTNLIVPKYASVELLDTQKRLNTNDFISAQVIQGGTIDVQVSGKII